MAWAPKKMTRKERAKPDVQEKLIARFEGEVRTKFNNEAVHFQVSDSKGIDAEAEQETLNFLEICLHLKIDHKAKDVTEQLLELEKLRFIKSIWTPKDYQKLIDDMGWPPAAKCEYVLTKKRAISGGVQVAERFVPGL